jgi:quercetin dioxygenase-like cupin family protein
MTQLKDGSFRFEREDLENLPWLGEGEDVMKILHVDETVGQVIFLQRFGPGSVHPRHTHHCTAIAHTLSGAWAYDGDRFPTGSVAFEPFGSTHTAMSDGERAEVLVILTAGPGSRRLIELHLPEGSVELDLDAFRRLGAMKSNDEWPAFAQQLTGVG